MVVGVWERVREERLDTAVRDAVDLRNDVRATWLALIRPSFDPYGALLVVQAATATMAGFAVEQGPLELDEMPAVEVSAVGVPAQWHDPVAHTLRELRLFEEDSSGFAVLDGISYSLEVSTTHLEACVSMSNPRAGTTLDLERKMLAAATDLSTRLLALRRYLETWNRYVH
jgi:hypothetical protein